MNASVTLQQLASVPLGFDAKRVRLSVRPFTSGFKAQQCRINDVLTTSARVTRTRVPRCSHVTHAKKGGDKSDKGGSDDDLEMAALEAETDAEERMKKAVEATANNFNTIRTGRANPAILDRIMVDYYGVPTALKQVAGVSVPDASTLMISPFDKSTLKAIEKAILNSDVGINPSNDGERIRLNVPQLTQDRRKELAKQVSKMGEEGKVAVRNVRKDSIKKLDKYDFPKDTRKDLEASIQKLTDNFVKRIDEIVKQKSDEVLKV